MAEIDSLEIKIQSESEQASRSLDKLIGKLSLITQGISAITSNKGLSEFSKNAESAAKNTEAQAKKAVRSLEQVKEASKNIGKGFRIEGDFSTVQKGLQKYKNELEKVKLKEETLSAKGKINTDSYKAAIVDAQKYTNIVESLENQLKEMQSIKPNIEITISWGEDTENYLEQAEKVELPVPAFNYNAEAMKAVFGDVAEGINNYRDAVEKFGPQAGSVMNELSEKAKISIKDVKDKMEEFNQSLQLIKVPDVREENLDKLYSSLDKTEQKVGALRNELANGITMGRISENVDDSGYVKLREQIALAEKQAEALRGKIEEVKQSTKGFKIWIEEAATSVGKFGASIGKLALNATPLGRIIQKVSGANKNMTSSFSGGFKTILKYVFGIRSLYILTNKLRSAFSEGMKNLVQYSDEANRSVSSMTSALSTLKNALTVAFAPIVNVVAPYITSFINMLTDAFNAVGRFFSALTGHSFAVQAKKTYTDYAAGLDDVSSSAADAAKSVEDLKTITLGIDELNINEPNQGSRSGSGSGSGGGTGGAGAGINDMFETVSIEDDISSLAQKVKEAWKKADFTEIGAIVGTKLKDALEKIPWDPIKETASRIGKSLATLINGFVEVEGLGYTIGETISEAINTGILGINSFFGNVHWDSVGAFITQGISGVLGNLDWGEVSGTLSSLVSGSIDFFTGLIKGVDWSTVPKAIVNAIADFLSGFDYAKVFGSFGKFIGTAIAAGIDLLGALAEVLADAWDGVVDYFSGYIEDSGGNIVVGLWNGIVNAIGNAGAWIYDNIFKPFIEGFKTAFGIHSPSTVMAEMGGYIMQGLADGISAMISNVVAFFAKLWERIEGVFANVKDFFKEKFNSAYLKIQEIFKPINTWFQGKWDAVKGVFKDIQAFFKSGFESAYKAVTKAFSGISSFFKGIANDIIDPIQKAVNGVINGINWILEKLNIPKSKWISNWTNYPKFASGTNGLPQDTVGVVNDQPGSTYKEMIVPPNGKPFIPEGRNVMLPLEKGTKIMPAGQTKQFLDSMPHFASGIGDFFGGIWESVKGFTGNVLDYLTNPEKIVQIAIDKFTDVSGWTGLFADMASGAINTVFSSAVDFIKSIFDSTTTANYTPGAGVEQWRALATKALQITGQYTESNLNALLMQMQHESGGNPKAINNWDINAKRGTPSKGLMQVIDPTFRAYALAPYNQNVYDPLSNMIASIRYTVSRYGSLYAGWTARGYKGYANGIGKISLSELIPAYSVGGFPEDGLFYANHNELVGEFSNGKTAAANNEQIVEGIKQGVKEAVRESLLPVLQEVADNTKETAAKDMTVKLDTRTIVSAMDKRKTRNGFSFA